MTERNSEAAIQDHGDRLAEDIRAGRRDADGKWIGYYAKPVTIEQLLASDDPADEAMLDEITQSMLHNDPDDDPFEDDGYPGEDQDQGDLDCERDA
jgi:hypothetical protein